METIIKVEQSEGEDIRNLHAHVCENCLKNGKQVLWMHGNFKGDDAKHTCPECGEKQWKKCHVPVAELPKVQTQAAVAKFSDIDTFVNTLMTIAVIALGVAYGMFFYDVLKQGKLKP